MSSHWVSAVSRSPLVRPKYPRRPGAGADIKEPILITETGYIRLADMTHTTITTLPSGYMVSGAPVKLSPAEAEAIRKEFGDVPAQE